jgi:hypothetical protein
MLLDYIRDTLNDNTQEVIFKVGRYYTQNNSELIFYEQNSKYAFKYDKKTYAPTMLEFQGTPSAIVGAFSNDLTIQVTIAFDYELRKEYINAIEEFRGKINAKTVALNAEFSCLFNSSELIETSLPIKANNMNLVTVAFTIFGKLTNLIISNTTEVYIKYLDEDEEDAYEMIVKSDFREGINKTSRTVTANADGFSKQRTIDKTWTASLVCNPKKGSVLHNVIKNEKSSLDFPKHVIKVIDDGFAYEKLVEFIEIGDISVTGTEKTYTITMIEVV